MNLQNRFVLLFMAVGLAACAWLEPASQLRLGQTESEVTQLMGAAHSRHDLQGGIVRLEYRRGPAGQTTWMVDLDRAGRVIAAEQVLNQASFARVVEGMPGAELLRMYGQPSHRQREWQNKQTWSWRYPTNDCLWFRVTLSPAGQVVGGGGYMTDPVCDVNDTVHTWR